MSERTGQWKFWRNLYNKGFNMKGAFEVHRNKHMGNEFRCVNCNHAFYHEGQLQ